MPSLERKSLFEGLLTYLDGVFIGKVVFDLLLERYSLEYDASWVEGKGFPVSPHLGFNGAPDDSVRKFLSNLLPEGQWLEELSVATHTSKSNTFGLIAEIGAETTGALTFRVEGDGTEPIPTSFRPIAPTELEERIRQRYDVSISRWDGKQRLSTAGVQNKLPVLIKNDGSLGFGEGDLASTHILKFDTKKNVHLVLNEFICMTLARLVGLTSAEVRFERIGEPVLVVKRFDREWDGAGRVKRLHLIDGCQMLDLTPTYKYERPFGREGHVGGLRTGASLPSLFKSAELCRVPALVSKEIVNWVFFQLLIGNSDAHAKNISFFVGSHGINLAPAYDMVCLDMCGVEYDRSLAMAIGDEFNLEDVQARQLAEMCEVCSLPRRQVAKNFSDLCKKVLRALDITVVPDGLNNEERDFAARQIAIIRERTTVFQDHSRKMIDVKL